MASSRPRVYLIDFELAISFPDDCPLEKRVCMGVPVGGSVKNMADYARGCPPEVESGEPYDPFKLDVWQFGAAIEDYQVCT